MSYSCINRCNGPCLCMQPSPPNPVFSDKKVTQKDVSESHQARQKRLLQAQVDLAKSHPDFAEGLKKAKEELANRITNIITDKNGKEIFRKNE